VSWKEPRLLPTSKFVVVNRWRITPLSATALCIWTPLLTLRSGADVRRQHYHAQIASCGRRCGVERWEIKTLSDAERDRVDRTPHETTVEELAALPRPQRTPQYSRVAPTELTTFRVDAYLGGYRPESDGDMHLILFGMENQRVSMIAEIPNPNCSGACASGLTEDFAKARTTLQEILAASNPVDEPIVVRVTGVGFFDRNHGQVGAAPNWIELHPVLAIERARAHER